jgi:hypothetical protein
VRRLCLCTICVRECVQQQSRVSLLLPCAALPLPTRAFQPSHCPSTLFPPLGPRRCASGRAQTVEREETQSNQLQHTLSSVVHPSSSGSALGEDERQRVA